MSNQSVVFDIPQEVLSVPPASYRDEIGYDYQQTMVPPRKPRFDTGESAYNNYLSYVYEHPQSKKDFLAQLRALQQHYTILDDDRTFIELLASDSALYSLLIEAVEPLRHAFGDKWLIYIRIQSSDEDSILKVTVRLPANFGDNPERALQAFDEEWWLNNCHRSSSLLVFDYELQNAI
jgi:hypothetical protein